MVHYKFTPHCATQFSSSSTMTKATSAKIDGIILHSTVTLPILEEDDVGTKLTKDNSAVLELSFNPANVKSPKVKTNVCKIAGT
jgi:hypothetical protein